MDQSPAPYFGSWLNLHTNSRVCILFKKSGDRNNAHMLFNIYFNIKQDNTERRRRIRGDLGPVSRIERKGAKSKGRRAPCYRLSPDHFQKLNWMLAPDWGQKLFSIFVLKPWTAYLEFFLCVRTRRLLSRHTCPVRSTRLCVQGKLSYLLIFPNQKRRNYRWLGRKFRMLSAATFQFAPRNVRRAFSLDPTDCPWVSEDDDEEDIKKEFSRLLQDRIFAAGYPSSFLTPHDTA